MNKHRWIQRNLTKEFCKSFFEIVITFYISKWIYYLNGCYTVLSVLQIGYNL